MNIDDVLLDLGVDVINNAKEEVPVSSGELRQSLQILDSNDGVVLGTKKEYAGYVAEGSDPHYPPIEPLKKWVKRKLGLNENVAYAIQQKIGAKGTKGNPFMKKAIDKTMEDL